MTRKTRKLTIRLDGKRNAVELAEHNLRKAVSQIDSMGVDASVRGADDIDADGLEGVE